VVFELDASAVQQRELPSFQAIGRFQAVQRDLAFVVSASVSHDELIAALRDDPTGMVRNATLFDLYRPHVTGDAAPGEHSMAVRLELMDDAVTLTDERIEAALRAAKERALERVGGRLRT
jgi:phenylalanyl-tRNA synthetase beta chain